MSCRGKRARVILDDDADYDDDGADGDYTPAIDVDESFAAASDDDSTRVHHTMGTSAAAIVSSKGVPDRRKRRKTSDGGEAPVTASQRQWKRSPPSRPVAAAAMDPVEIVRRLQQRAKDAEQYQTAVRVAEENHARERAEFERARREWEAERTQQAERIDRAEELVARQNNRIYDQEQTLSEYRAELRAANHANTQYKMWELSKSDMANTMSVRQLNNALVKVRDVAYKITEAMEARALAAEENARTLQDLQLQTDATLERYIARLCPINSVDAEECMMCMRRLPRPLLMKQVRSDGDGSDNSTRKDDDVWPFSCQCCTNADMNICIVCVSKEHAVGSGANYVSQQDLRDGVYQSDAKYVVRRCPWCKAVRRHDHSSVVLVEEEEEEEGEEVVQVLDGDVVNAAHYEEEEEEVYNESDY